MPPVYAQQNDAARHRYIQLNTSNYVGHPTAQSMPSPATTTTAERIARLPTTADRLASRPTLLDQYRSPTSPNPAQQNSVFGPIPPPTPQVATPDHASPISLNLYKNDVFEVATPSGGARQSHRTDYDFNPNTRRFEAIAESNSVPKGANTISILGGVSDNFRYNNDDSQKPDTTKNVNVGDTVWKARGLVEALPSYRGEASVGSENLGASADITAGLQANASASYGYNGDSLEAKLEGSVFVGVEVNAEAHAAYGPVAASVEGEARAGASADASAALTFDPRNGVSGELGVGGFAGAEVNLEANGELGDSADVTGGVAFKAGIGAEANADIEFGLDEIGGELNLGATLGVGMDVTLDVSISPSGIIDDAGDTFNGAKDLVGSLFG